MWHDAQSFGVPAYRPFTWHCEHVTDVCAPVSGKVVFTEWLNVDGIQAVVLWHVSHV
jgi:hypothetical protein